MHPRIEILKKIDELENGHCKGCKIHAKNGEQRSSYCNKQCDIGKKLQYLGQLLLDNSAKKLRENKPKSSIKIYTIPKKKEMEPVKQEPTKKKEGLTKEVFLKLSGEGKSNVDIMAMYGMGHNLFYKLKKEWGLTDNSKAGRPKQSQKPKEIKQVEKKVEPPIEKKLETEKEVDSQLAEKSTISQLAEKSMDQLAKKIKENVENISVSDVSVEKQVIEMEKYNEIISQNKKLKAENEKLFNEKVEMNGQFQLALRENEMLEDRVQKLLSLEKKYQVTSAALKMHLPE